MKPYDELTQRGRIQRLRGLAEVALAAYELPPWQMEAEHHGHNTTFRIQTENGDYALRISKPDWRSRAQIESEAIWLASIRRDTELIVPEPVPNRLGELLTVAGAEGVPEERCCLLFRWIDGQFYRKRISPVALERVGRFTAHLHNHVEQDFSPPPGFIRPSVQWQTVREGDQEIGGDMERVIEDGLAVGVEIITPEDLATFTMARHYIREEMDALPRTPDFYNLIHADLHHGNYLFHRQEVRAIDFDDCGWGHFLYDLAVTEWYLQARPDFSSLREAHLRGYREVRPFSEEQEALLPTFLAARSLMIAMYLASRKDNPRLWQQAPQFIHRSAANLRLYLQDKMVE
jgi:Ser/Thr protein kinase RdoA (MazF antagonist)